MKSLLKAIVNSSLVFIIIGALFFGLHLAETHGYMPLVGSIFVLFMVLYFYESEENGFSKLTQRRINNILNYPSTLSEESIKSELLEFYTKKDKAFEFIKRESNHMLSQLDKHKTHSGFYKHIQMVKDHCSYLDDAIGS